MPFFSPSLAIHVKSDRYLNLNNIVFKIVIIYESFALQKNEDEMNMIFSNASHKMLYF